MLEKASDEAPSDQSNDVSIHSHSDVYYTKADAADSTVAETTCVKDVHEVEVTTTSRNYATDCSIVCCEEINSRCDAAGDCLQSKLHKHKRLVKILVALVAISCFAAYLGFAFACNFGDYDSILLLVVSILIVFYLVYDYIALCVLWIANNVYCCRVSIRFIMVKGKYIRLMLWVAITLTCIGVVVEIGVRQPENLTSLLGLFGLLLLCYALSTNRRNIPWKTVYAGMVIQLAFAVLLLRFYIGTNILIAIGQLIQAVISNANAGSLFVFGESYEEHYFAFVLAPMILFFGALVSVLYYVGAAQWLVRKLGYAIYYVIEASPAESIVAASNVFIGPQDALLFVQPLIKDLTVDELSTLITCGLASVSADVIALYSYMGIPTQHLLAASLLSAPAAIACAKLLQPNKSKVLGQTSLFSRLEKPDYVNVIQALSVGASTCLPVVVHMVVGIIVFISTLSFVNSVLTWIGYRVCMQQPLTFQLICSYIFWPVAFILGVPVTDCHKVAELIGIKIFLNEYIGYTQLGTMISNGDKLAAYNGTASYLPNGNIFLPTLNETLIGGVMSEKSEVISTYVMCGYSDIATLGFMVGVVSFMVPEKKNEIAKRALRILIGGNAACMMTAAVSGLFYLPS